MNKLKGLEFFREMGEKKLTAKPFDGASITLSLSEFELSNDNPEDLEDGGIPVLDTG
jgi:hypothetical protein